MNCPIPRTDWKTSTSSRKPLIQTLNLDSSMDLKVYCNQYLHLWFYAFWRKLEFSIIFSPEIITAYSQSCSVILSWHAASYSVWTLTTHLSVWKLLQLLFKKKCLSVVTENESPHFIVFWMGKKKKKLALGFWSKYNTHLLKYIYIYISSILPSSLFGFSQVMLNNTDHQVVHKYISKAKMKFEMCVITVQSM